MASHLLRCIIYTPVPKKTTQHSSILSSPPQSSLGLQLKSETNQQTTVDICSSASLSSQSRHETKMEVDLFHDMEFESDRFYYLVDCFCRIEDFETALNYAMDMIGEDFWIPPSVTTMKNLVNGLVSISKVKDAKKLVEKLKNRFPNNSDKWSELEEGLPQES